MTTTTIQIPSERGGTNVPYNDGTGPFGMASKSGYGYTQYFMPLLAEFMAMLESYSAEAGSQIDAAAASAAEAATSQAGAATAQANAETAQANSELAEANAETALAAAEVARDAAQAYTTAVRFATKALMDASLAYAANTIAFVYADATLSNNGEYYKVGASGTGSWAASQINRLAGIAANFTRLTSVNLYDPNISDHVDDSNYNTNGSVALGAARWHRSGLVPVTPGQSIVIDQTNTDSIWFIFRAGSGPNIHGYTAGPAGTSTFWGLIPATFGDNDRSAIIPSIPNGVNFVAWNSRYPTGTAPDAAAYALMRSRTMVSLGAAKVPFVAYRGPHDYAPKTYTYEETDPVVIVRSGTSMYVRQPYAAAYSQVRLMSVGVAASFATNGAVDEVAAMRIPIATLAADTANAYLAAGTADRLCLVADNAAPEKENGLFMGQGHGPTAFQLTKATAHGLTNSNVGDVGVDGAARAWVLVRIVDATNILVVADNVGTATEWYINAVLTGSTITFSGGAGAYAFTASTQTQAWPALQNYSAATYMDGVAVPDGGVYSGELGEIREKYGIPNIGHWLATLKAEKGTLTPKNPNDAAIQTQIEVSRTVRFDRYGGKLLIHSRYTLQQHAVLNGSDYYGGGQHNSPHRNTGETSWAYAPGLSSTVGGYNLTARADITALAVALDILVSHCEDPNDPMSHFGQFTKDSTGAEKFGFGTGYVRNVGLAVPAVRKTKIVQCAQISAPHKMYLHASDWGAGLLMAAGVYTTVMVWEGFHDMSSNPTHTINRLVKLPNGKVHWIFDVHATLAAQWVVPGTLGQMPDELIGLPITILHKKSDTTVHSDFMTAHGARLSTVSGYGRLVAELG